MKNYDITVFYAYHEANQDIPAFPRQTMDTERIQILPVLEDDVYWPRRRTLEVLDKAEGRYIIMLDEGDQFSEQFLEDMLKEAEDSIAFSMPGYIWQATMEKIRARNFFLLKETETLTVDTTSNPLIFPGDLHGLLIPAKALQTASVNPEYPVETEKQIILRLLEDHPVFRYVGKHQITYAVSKDCNLGHDIRCHTRGWYYDSLEQFLLPLLQKTKAPGCLLSYLTIHMINLRVAANLNNRNKHVLSPEEVPAYYELLSDILQFIDAKVMTSSLTDSAPAAIMAQELLFYFRVKKREGFYYPEIRVTKDKKNVELYCDDCLFGNLSLLPVHLVRMDYSDGKLEIDGRYVDFIQESSAQVYLKFGKESYPLSYNKRYSLVKYFGVSASRSKTFHVSVPVSESKENRKLIFVLKAEGKEFPLEYVFANHGSRFAKDFGYAYWRFGKYLSYWQKDGIHVVPSNPLLVLKKEVCVWLQMWKKKNGMYREMLPLKILNFLLQPYYSRRKIWFFMDKIYKGADSSEYIYKYAEKQKDGIHKYYLLDKSSADYTRMVKEGYKPLVRGTLKHYLTFLNADMVIASNSTVFAFNDFTFDRSLPFRGNAHFDVACVQHGMSIQKIAIAQQRLRDNTRLYFCASKYEIENLSKPEYDYEGYDALKLTGVPRYDGLVNRAEKILVISPTWRMQSALPVKKSEGFARDYNPNFKESEYYRVYNGLINDPRLLDAARRYGYRIQYVLHPIVSPQHEDFDKNDLVEIIPSIGDMSYEKIFCEGALMVTDFSGVQFDFAYMRKPVIYLHHNDIPQHYDEGTFYYDTMGFGEICHTNEELIDTLCRYMENNCEMPEMYRKRADDFFAFSDNHNCERIYPIMLEYERSRK